MRAEQIVVRQCHRSRVNRRGVLLLRCGADRGVPVPRSWEIAKFFYSRDVELIVVRQCHRSWVSRSGNATDSVHRLMVAIPVAPRQGAFAKGPCDVGG